MLDIARLADEILPAGEFENVEMLHGSPLKNVLARGYGFVFLEMGELITKKFPDLLLRLLKQLLRYMP
jgi:hypothetical protein